MRILVTLFAAAIAGCAASRQSVTPVAGESEQLKEAFAAWVRVSEAGDAASYLDYLTDDAVIISAGRPPISGKAAIRPWITSFFEQVAFRFSDGQWQEIQVHGNWALRRYTGVATITRKSGGAAVRQERQYVDLLRKAHDGRWRVSHHIVILDR